MTAAKEHLHVAIIPDGNRRWAKSHALGSTAGHEKVAQYEHLKQFLEEAKRLGVTYLSFWAFSTENWQRPEYEKKILFELLETLIMKLREDANNLDVRFRWIGRRERIPSALRDELVALEEKTANSHSMVLQLCLDYGGRDEILRAVNSAIASGKKEFDEAEFRQLLDTTGAPDPDLIIRTSGEQRLSGFLPFQSVYAELYFCEKHFPDFTPEDLRYAVTQFKSRERRMGK